MPMPIPLIDLVPAGQPARPGQWWSSSGNAGQSTIHAWSPDMVRPRDGGGVDLLLGAAPAGSGRPAVGGEIRSADTASTGTFSWLAEAPDGPLKAALLALGRGVLRRGA